MSDGAIFNDTEISAYKTIAEQSVQITRLRAENEKLEQQVAEFVNKFTEDMFVLRAENERLQKQSVDSYNAAIDVAAMVAKTWGPPNWSWSESSIIIKDTCDEIALAIRGLKNCKR